MLAHFGVQGPNIGYFQVYLEGAYAGLVSWHVYNSWLSIALTANKDAIKLSCLYLEFFVAGIFFCLVEIRSSDSLAVEAIRRAAEVARSENKSLVESKHLEQILCQLLLDFS